MTQIESLFREYKITKSEQVKIMNVMDKYRELISKGDRVNHAQFEHDIMLIFGDYIGATMHKPMIDYHFCEHVAKSFMEDRRWEEVYQAIYGSWPKHGGKIGQ